MQRTTSVVITVVQRRGEQCFRLVEIERLAVWLLTTNSNLSPVLGMSAGFFP